MPRIKSGGERWVRCVLTRENTEAETNRKKRSVKHMNVRASKKIYFERLFGVSTLENENNNSGRVAGIFVHLPYSTLKNLAQSVAEEKALVQLVPLVIQVSVQITNNSICREKKWQSRKGNIVAKKKRRNKWRCAFEVSPAEKHFTLPCNSSPSSKNGRMSPWWMELARKTEARAARQTASLTNWGRYPFRFSRACRNELQTA